MENLKIYWKKKLFESMKILASEYGEEQFSTDSVKIVIETPPKPELGDLAFPLFPLAKIFRKIQLR